MVELLQFSDLEKLSVLHVTWKKKVIFAEFKDNLVHWTGLKHLTDLLALTFIVAFYPQV